MTQIGNRKACDQAFTYLSKTDPRALLAMLGALDADAPATVTRLPKELIASPLAADELYLVEMDGKPQVVHIAVPIPYARDVPRRLLDTASRVRITYALPVYAFLLLLTADGVPDPVPTEITIEVERLRLDFSYQVVKLWEFSATDFLTTERLSLLPLVPLMAGGREILTAAAARIVAMPDDTRRHAVQLHFFGLGGLCHDAETLVAAFARAARRDRAE
jgi:hypothetical protein